MLPILSIKKLKPIKARPLLRGISDSMSYGDGVIYTQIPHGGKNPHFYFYTS